MQFNSLSFLLFFVVVLGLYYSSHSWKTQKFILLAASLLFYAAWNPPFVLLLLFSIIVDWVLARYIWATESLSRRRLLLTLSLLANLGVLAYFKYANFMLEAFVSAAAHLGISYAPPGWNIVLPVGISFYTFQSLSYTIDAYRRKIEPNYSLLDYSFFVAFFPQLVAGPIVRAAHFLPQTQSPRTASADQFSWGLTLVCFGLFAKVVLADGLLAPVVDRVFEAPQNAARLEAWAAVFAFSGQIFFDFSGYTTCAIGVALCFGFHLTENFRAPYAAIGFSDFWRRWHISLSTWFRDYLYIPLGGNRAGSIRTAANVMVTMLVAGLWHGASWMFVIWGGLHGLLLVGERAFRRIVPASLLQSRDETLTLFACLGTFLVISVTWIFFRAPDMETAEAMFSALIFEAGTGVLPPDQSTLFVAAIVGLLVWHGATRERRLEEFFAPLPWWIRSLVLSAVVLSLVFADTEGDAFIYFQF